ncbi:MAG: hypothetical protein PVI43_00810 [Candidatus Bathyarchaeota archaeon]
MSTFRKALTFDEYITIGGGEPTLHKHFWQILGESIAAAEYVWLATNGSQTQIAIALAAMASKGVIGCALSQDYYHDEIDERVIEAFTKKNNSGNEDHREIRDVSGNEINAGRCDFGVEERCCCEDLIVKPNGDIFACGCEDSLKIGDVRKGYNLPDEWEIGECWKKQEVKLAGVK